MNAAVVDDLDFREKRRKYLGGSDIPALLGIAPPTWRRNSPVALYYDKIQPPKVDMQGVGVKRRGKRWESVVAEMLVEELEARGHTVEIVDANKRYTDPEFDFFASEVDFEVKLNGEEDITNVEIKTVHAFKEREWGESDTDDAPDYTIAQNVWSLGVTGRKRGIVAPLFGADKLRIVPIERDEETLAAMRGLAYRFWTENVLKRIPPDPLFLADMGLLFPTETEGSVLTADEGLTAHLLRLRAIDREIKAREAEYQAIEFDIKRAMRDHTEIAVLDHRGEIKSAATWKQRPYTYLDERGLKEKEPAMHKAFVRKGSSRVFSLKSFAWE